MFRAGQQHGEFRAFEPRVLALTISAALEAVPRELLDHPDTEVNSYARELAAIFVHAARA